ncbi:membrane dipeptidase [Pedobacter sp. Leaf170]|uniref:membrane dipeptidase n=1 Tax=Pedobacter sp. Leaf170 TaxID=2876558 RepID=UPI001E65118B|nr:membrane dipeptidase [Pedobacter sp. Leaf170]
MPYFDFHIHPTLKSMFTTGAAKTSPWQNIDTKKINWFIRMCSDFSRILGSQSNFQQLLDSRCNLVCIALFVPERGFIDNKLLKKQAEKSPLREYLNPLRLDDMISGRLKPFPDLVEEDLKLILSPKVTDDGKTVVALSYEVIYDEEDKERIYAVFTIEGCHTLSSTLDPKKINRVEVLTNLESLRKSYPILSINITHLEQYPFCNHAYGILFVESLSFIPREKEISADGIEIIRFCYERNILVDLKHMSLGARTKFIYDIRERADFAPIKQPLVCTHAGFTGLSVGEIPNYMQIDSPSVKGYSKITWGKPTKYQTYESVAFNPSSINLYDEEIIAILESDGMIGLSLDKRILGYGESSIKAEEQQDLLTESEYISNKELEYFITGDAVGEHLTPFYCITHEVVNRAVQSLVDVPFYHLHHFMAHVLHLMKISAEYGFPVKNALQKVCIGSDFDGLINPLTFCDSVLELPQFEKDFIKYFPRFLEQNNLSNLMPSGISIQQLARQLFFSNGRDFVLKRLPLILPTT